MRIRTMVAAAVLATATTLPLSGIALADEHDCTVQRVALDEVTEAQLDRLGCQPDQNHPVNRARPDHGQDKRDHDCVSDLREHLRDLDPERLREQLRDGDGIEDAKRDWFKDCRDDSSDHRKKNDHDKKKDGDDGDDSSDDSGSSSDDDSDDDDASTTQVKVVPKGSVDTGDGSSR